MMDLKKLTLGLVNLARNRIPTGFINNFNVEIPIYVFSMGDEWMGLHKSSNFAA